MDNPGRSAGSRRLDEMLLRSARYGEVQSKLDAILAAIRAPAGGSGAVAPAADVIPPTRDLGSATPEAMFRFLQAGRTPHAADRLRGTLAPDAAMPDAQLTRPSEVPEPADLAPKNQAPAETPPPPALTVQAAEDQLAERIARVEARLATLGSIESSVTALVSRFGVIEATHVESVRQAALLEVRHALAVERAAADAVAPDALAAVAQVRQELATVDRERRDEAQRLRTILTSLSASLERVTVRLDEAGRPARDTATLRGTIVDAPAPPKRPHPQVGARRRPLLEAIGLSRRSPAFA